MTDYRWTPSPELIEGSNLTRFLRMVGETSYETLLSRSNEDPAWLMEQVFRFADMRFFRPYHTMLDTSPGIERAEWCLGGTTNIVLNCLDRHRNTPVMDRPFLIWEGESSSTHRSLTYAEFDREVCHLAAALLERGIKEGDVVALFMPSIPEAIAAFFAVLKIGAIVMPLFSGFGPEPIEVRLQAGSARAVITSDLAWRRGKPIPMKQILDTALETVPSVDTVVVLARGPGDRSGIPMKTGRDLWYDELTAEQPSTLATREMDSGAPAVLLFSSGTTGKPKGCVWTHVGFLGSMAARDVYICGDFKPDDRYFFMSDMGWMVGAMNACIPSMFGGSVFLYEGAPDYPSPDRFWRMVERHAITYLGVSPSLVRGLMNSCSDLSGFDLSALRITMSAGEPWTIDTWNWFFEQVCRRRLPIINLTGGTEVGGAILIGTLHHPLNPGSFGAPALAMGADIVDAEGHPLGPGQTGELVLRQPSIGMTRSLWREDARFLETYWSTLPGIWLHGDLARKDTDGLYYLLGRSDDTLKIAGKRMGPSEIENVLLETGLVSDAAAVAVTGGDGAPALFCACIAKEEVVREGLEQQLSSVLGARMGASFRPKRILFVQDLPRTRNLKVMRRVVRSVLSRMPPGDLSSLINPECLQELEQIARTGT